MGLYNSNYTRRSFHACSCVFVWVTYIRAHDGCSFINSWYNRCLSVGCRQQQYSSLLKVVICRQSKCVLAAPISSNYYVLHHSPELFIVFHSPLVAARHFILSKTVCQVPVLHELFKNQSSFKSFNKNEKGAYRPFFGILNTSTSVHHWPSCS
jgi:hypothetical protein